MSSPSSPSQAPSSIPLAGTGVHGLKRSRDAHPVDQQTELAVERRSNDTGLASVVMSDSEDQSPNQAKHPPTPLAKKGRRVSKNSMDEQTSPPPTNLSKGTTTQSHTPSNEGSDHGSSRMVTPEATEVKSVRKKVEGMGVENDQDQAHEKPEDETMCAPTSQPITSTKDSSNSPNQNHPNTATLQPSPIVSERASDQQLKTCTTSKSDALPASWASYAHSSSPFALHAPSTNVSIFTNPDQPSKSTSVPPSTNTSARAFAGPHKSSSSGLHAHQPNTLGGPSSLSSASPNFPTSSDFFLKGKRNNWLGNSSTEPESDASTQNKKPKLPDTTTTNITAFEAYSNSKPTSLKPAALARLNNNASLQMPSLTAPHLNVGRPQSAASSVCAVNGDTEEPSPPISPSSLIKPTPSPLGFSAFANSSSFGNSAVNGSSSSSTSVFDQPILSTEIGEKSLIGKKKTHLALSADLSEEDRHSGFGAKELITGEENEKLIKSVRCKLFTLAEDGTWLERGTGLLRLLCTKLEPFRYRLIMRADAVHRVLLNVPIFKGFNYLPSQDKFLSFAGTIHHNSDDQSTLSTETTNSNSNNNNNNNSQFQQYLCRFAKPEVRQEMIESIKQCLDEVNSRRIDQTDSNNEVSLQEEV